MPGAILPQNPKLVAVDTVIIDSCGRFQYILCSVSDPEKPGDEKLVIRGTADADFHADIYDELDSYLEEQGLTCQCKGGGKILHDPEAKKIELSGQSQGFGAADHSEAANLLRAKFPDYHISWT